MDENSFAMNRPICRSCPQLTLVEVVVCLLSQRGLSLLPPHLDFGCATSDGPELRGRLTKAAFSRFPDDSSIRPRSVGPNHPDGLGRSHQLRRDPGPVWFESRRCDQIDAIRAETLILPVMASTHCRKENQTRAKTGVRRWTLPLPRPTWMIHPNRAN